ncbi:MAG: ATP-binding protein, partial [Bacteroidota bacterium]
WIGTFNAGLEYHYQHQLKYNLFYSKGQISGIKSNYVTAFATDAADNIWIGAGEEGLLYFNRATKTFENIHPTNTDPQNLGSSKENFYIFSLLLSDDEEHLYIGTLTGFYDFHIATNRWRYWHYETQQTSETTFNGLILSMAQDADKVYLATFEGLSIYDKQQKTIENIPSPRPNFLLYATLQTDSLLYLGTRHYGVWQFDKATQSVKPIAKGNKDVVFPNFVARMHLDKQNRILVSGSTEGTFRYDQRFSTMERLPQKWQGKKLVVMSITDAPESGYWMATNLGLAKVSDQFSIEKILGQNEGFIPSYFATNALHKTPKEEILIGGNAGFYSFYDDNFYQPRNNNAPIHLTDFLLLNKSVVASEIDGFQLDSDLEEENEITLPRYKNLLTFEYAALDYHNPARLQYAYRLEPYEKKWNRVGNRRFATYRELPAGDYTFRVKYQVDAEQLSEQEATLRVTIPPKPWETWWAYLIYASIIGWISRQFYTYRKSRRQFKQQLAMQQFQKEKMEELYQFKIDFFTQVTHELRTPLTLISGPLEEVLHRQKEQSTTPLLKIIQRNTQKLLRTVNQVLDFRKIENLEMKVFAKKGNVVSFVEEIVQSFRRMTTQKGIKLQFETNMRANPYVLFDKDILEKILVNLLANALKFTEKGTICLSLDVCPDQQGKYTITLQDTGRGIKKENLPHIFDSFFQEKREMTMVGSGLGLKIVKELVTLHHGTIQVDSTLHQGTTFELSFPIADLDLMNEEPARPSIAQAINQSTNQIVTAKADTIDAKILIVDDEADVLSFLEEVFAKNYEVLVVKSAKKAIEVAKTEMPDLIISDVMMPEMDGFELCNYTKADFLLNHIPVILLTALGSTEHEIEGLNEGADAYISKPFPVNLLKATVQNLLTSRQQLKKAFLSTSLTESAPIPAQDASQQLVHQVVKIVHNRIRETHLEIADIAQELGMSQSTFYRKIKSLVGISGNEFIRTIRLKKALEYLKHSDYNISEIAYRVGFSDPKYFSTCFKKFYNVTPTEFVQKQRVS